MPSTYKVKTWQDGPIPKRYIPLAKIDGVHVHIKEGVALSKHGKPLYNLDRLVERAKLMNIDKDSHWEYYHNDWNTSVSEVRTKKGTPVDPLHCYLLPHSSHAYDSRLLFSYSYDISQEFSEDLVNRMLDSAVSRGLEGLVFMGPDGKLLRVKPFLSYDVEIKDYYEGKGKFSGMLGGVVTEMGKVGVFTGPESIREDLWNDRDKLVGRVIEVKCFELTKTGKFRHPRMIRFRPDKEE